VRGYVNGGDVPMKNKGISMAVADFFKIVDARAAVAAALSRRDAAYELLLSNNVRVTVSSFKNAWSVGVRKYYVDAGGARCFGKPGINLTETSWNSRALHVCGLRCTRPQQTFRP
jgi:hypothetical protein